MTELYTWDDLSVCMRLSRRTLFRLSKTDPDFPRKLTIRNSPRFRRQDVMKYIDVLAKRAEESA